MATIVLGAVGLAVGSYFGNPQLGFEVGVAVGGAIDARSHQRSQSLGRLSDLKISGSQYGVIIPRCWGRYRLPINLIDYTTDVNNNFLHESSKKKGSKTTGTTRVYSYTASFACLICTGPVTRVRKIWAADRLLYNADAVPTSAYNIRIYLGDETQMPDSLLSTFHGSTQTPAYRGSCYFVVQDLPLADWGNAIPNPMSAEVEKFTDYHTMIQATSGLQTYYRFDVSPGQLVDSGILAHNLSAVGSPTTISGHANEGVSCLTGSSFRAIIGNEPIYQPARFSVEAWFQWGETSEIYGAGAVTYQNPNTAEFPWKLRVSPEAVSLEHLDLQFSINTNANPNVTVFHWNVPFDNLWHHWVVTYDTTGNAILYFDGVAQVTTAVPVSAIAITSDALSQVNITSGSNGQLHWDEVAFYNRVLTPAEVLLHYQGATMTLSTIMADLFDAEGLTGDQWDVSAAVDTVDGFGLTDRGTARDALDPAIRAYKTLLAEYDGKIVAVKRGGAAVVTIPAADLGAMLWSGSNTPTPSVESKRLQELELPFRVDLTYLSAIRSYQSATQGAERYTKVKNQDPLTITTPLVLTDDAARQAAEQQLHQIWTERTQFTFSLPLSYLYLAPGDVVNLPVLGQTLRVRLTQMDAALPGPIQCMAVLDDVGILTQVAAGAAVISIGDPVTDVTSTTLIIWNGDALVDADADTLGLYFVANGATAGYWPGAQLYWSTDAGASYQELSAISDGATIGTALTALPIGPEPGAWDMSSTLDVNIVSGEAPVTTSDADVIAGSNAALVGQEVIQYATVTALGGTQYRLSRLVRGRRGTDSHASEHVIGERFALLDSGVVKRDTLTESFRGADVLVKAVTPGETIGGVIAATVYVEGAEARPYAPCHISGARNMALDLTISFVRRTRAGGGLPSPLTIPLSEATELYDVSIMAGSPVTVTGITQAAVPTVTAPSHGFTNGQRIAFAGVLGMTAINGLIGTVSGATTNTLTLSDLSTIYMPAYSGSSGTAERVVRSFAPTSPSQVYVAASQTSDFGSTQPAIRVLVTQIGAHGRGYSALATL